MKTRLSEAKLVELRAEKEVGRVRRFQDPYTIAKCLQVLRRRGEIWAESVCGRSLVLRSRIDGRYPAFRDGEPELLVAADIVEDAQVTDGLEAQF